MDSKQEQLKKVLLLEKQKGCQDKAVIGGLDGYLRRLQAAQDGVLSLSKDGLPELRSLLDTRYGALSPAQRERWLDRVLAALAGEGGALSPDKSKPKNARPGPQHSLARAPSPEVPRKPPSVCHPERSEGSVPGKRGAPSVRRKGETDSSVAEFTLERSEGLPQNDSPGPKPSPDPQGDSPVTVLSGVRSHLAAKLAKLGVSTLRDLLYFFPRRHVDYSQVRPIAQLEIEVEQTVVGFVWEAAVKHLGRTGRGTEAIIGDDTGNLKARWYHQPYLAAKLRPNTRVALSGKIAIFRGQKVLESPELELLEGEELIHTGRLVPIYPLTEGLSPRTVRRLTKEVLDRYGPSWPDFLPREIKEQAHPSTGSGVALSPSKGHGLLDLPQALRQAHFPDSLALKDEARQRLAFDELFLIQLGMIGRKREWQEGQRAPVLKGDGDALQTFLSSLPFPLTPAQERVMKEIRDDLSRDRPMSRLLQGEVGSGKTVVATAALLLAATSGYQASFMAPTEILAEQHFQSLGRLLSGLPHPVAEGHLLSIYLDPWPRPILLGLLTGGLKEREKEGLRGLIAQGSVDIVVGTHALIEGDVEFARLGLAVIDEQHRFGVMQRSALRQKGSSPHMLAMTATPIPRTLALTLYGDLDLSVLDQLPPGRQEIKTRWLRPDQRVGAYEFVRRQATQGRQAFVICPLIEESEAIEAKAAVTEYQRLSQEVFPDLRLGLLHGRMPAAEKEEAMRRFRAGDWDILVSTPVVEVGIDVPNATVMLVEGADRFGLSQLHQFRGRVGRGEYPSYCILLAQSPSLEGVQRLKVLEETRDGFALAEEDLKLRGPGEFFGTRQSGLPDLRMARLSDAPLLELARREALGLFEKDPELKKPEHRQLAQELARLWKNTTEEMS